MSLIPSIPRSGQSRDDPDTRYPRSSTLGAWAEVDLWDLRLEGMLGGLEVRVETRVCGLGHGTGDRRGDDVEGDTATVACQTGCPFVCSSKNIHLTPDQGQSS
jgi:hypothetical protein